MLFSLVDGETYDFLGRCGICMTFPIAAASGNYLKLSSIFVAVYRAGKFCEKLREVSLPEFERQIYLHLCSRKLKGKTRLNPVLPI